MHTPIVQRKQTSEQYSEPEVVTSALTLAGNQIKCTQPETDSITGNLICCTLQWMKYLALNQVNRYCEI